MSAAQQDTETRAPSPTAMRAAAAWFLDQRTLPRHEVLKLWSDDLTAFIQRLMPEIEALAAGLPPSDVPVRVATVDVGEARRRLREPDVAGPNGETERVKGLARSVVALCDHHGALTGASTCLACDKRIHDGETWLSYDKFSPSGGAVQSGRMHTACASTGRPRR
ncbi:DUF6415 family natural product biosynthesis protein [Streptomyces sp. NRRL F-5140]